MYNFFLQSIIFICVDHSLIRGADSTKHTAIFVWMKLDDHMLCCNIAYDICLAGTLYIGFYWNQLVLMIRYFMIHWLDSFILPFADKSLLHNECYYVSVPKTSGTPL